MTPQPSAPTSSTVQIRLWPNQSQAIRKPGVAVHKSSPSAASLSELCRRRAERARRQFLQRLLTQFLRKHFNSKRACVSRFQNALHKSRNLELAFTTKPSVVDRVFK